MQFSMLLEKQGQKVCKPRCCWNRGMRGHPQAYGVDHSWMFHAWFRRGARASPRLWSSPILDISQFGVPSFPVKKLQHKNSLILFQRGDISGIRITCNLWLKPQFFFSIVQRLIWVSIWFFLSLLIFCECWQLNTLSRHLKPNFIWRFYSILHVIFMPLMSPRRKDTTRKSVIRNGWVSW